MIQGKKNQDVSYKAFTLMEMIIVLIIIGIMLMATIFLSGEQIQKVKDKTVKESILAEMQSRYSRNLGSSSFAGLLYSTMDVTFKVGENKIDFKYNARNDDNESKENSFSDRFEIKYITTSGDPGDNLSDSVTLHYTPYQISCQIGKDDKNYGKVIIVTRVNDSKDYCFEINQKNCGLVAISEEKCKELETLANLN